jgi:hypothetical protein
MHSHQNSQQRYRLSRHAMTGYVTPVRARAWHLLLLLPLSASSHRGPEAHLEQHCNSAVSTALPYLHISTSRCAVNLLSVSMYITLLSNPPKSLGSAAARATEKLNWLLPTPAGPTCSKHADTVACLKPAHATKPAAFPEFRTHDVISMLCTGCVSILKVAFVRRLQYAWSYSPPLL